MEVLERPKLWTPSREIVVPGKIAVPRIIHARPREFDPQMAAALVGVAGTAVQSAAAGSAASPAYGQTPTAGNTLACLVAGTGTAATLPTDPGGIWTKAAQIQRGTGAVSTIYVALAAGGDAAPSFPGAAGMLWAAQLLEFSGSSRTTDQTNTGSGISTQTSPLVVTNPALDAATGQIGLAVASIRHTAATTSTKTHTFNNATAVAAANGGSTANHYSLAYGITTSNGSAFSDSFAFTTTNLNFIALAVLTLKLAATGKALPIPRRRLYFTRL